MRQAAPDGRVLGRLCDGLGKLAVFEAARSRSYADLFCKKFLVVLFSNAGKCAPEIWQRQSVFAALRRDEESVEKLEFDTSPLIPLPSRGGEEKNQRNPRNLRTKVFVFSSLHCGHESVFIRVHPWLKLKRAIAGQRAWLAADSF